MSIKVPRSSNMFCYDCVIGLCESLFISDCGMMSLPSYISCDLSNNCSKIICCLSVQEITRNLDFELDIDSCNFEVVVRFEKYVFKRNLFDFKWGKFYEPYRNTRVIYSYMYILKENSLASGLGCILCLKHYMSYVA